MPAIRVEHLSKWFGAVRAVQDLSFTAEPGTITGFLGPNGAGKTTTLRSILGLVTPSDGRTLIGDRPYRDLERPAEVVGAVLEATGFHPGRKARDHLRVVCSAAGFPATRVDEVLTLVGLQGDVSRRSVGGYSLGMRQRLSLAAALLGDPPVLILDEPMNGLDPGGIHWLRAFLRQRADNGGTVLFSSHVLSEVEQTVDHVVIVHEGRLIRDAPLDELTTGSGRVRVRTPQADELTAALAARGASVEPSENGAMLVAGLEAEEVGRTALTAQVVLSELVEERSGLERTFLDLTRVQFTAPQPAVPPDQAPGSPPGVGTPSPSSTPAPTPGGTPHATTPDQAPGPPPTVTPGGPAGALPNPAAGTPPLVATPGSMPDTSGATPEPTSGRPTPGPAAGETSEPTPGPAAGGSQS